MTKTQRIIGLLAALAVLFLAGCAGSESSRSTGTYIDDKAITAKIEANLAQDSLTQALQVEIETYKGVVQLSGFVDSQEKIDRAGEIARNVPGVKKVVNNIALR